MSQTAYLLWHTSDPDIVTAATLPIIARIMRSTLFESLYTHRIQEGPHESYEMLDLDLVASNIRAEHLIDYFDTRNVLIGLDDNAELGNLVARAIRQEIGASIRGDFLPDRACFSLGKEWRQDASDASKSITMTMSIGVWCYGMPIDIDETRKRIGSVPAIREVADELANDCAGVEIDLLCYY